MALIDSARYTLTTRRLFLSVDLSISVVEQMVLMQESLQPQLRSKAMRARWVDPENIHLTLKFIGDTDEALIGLIDDRMHELVKPLFPFQVACRGIQAYPDPKRARLLYVALDQKSAEVLGLLQKAIERDLGELGLAQERREFKPHITLGRIKSDKAANLSDILTPLVNEPLGRSYIKDIILYQGERRDDGPRYTVLERYSLGAM